MRKAVPPAYRTHRLPGQVPRRDRDREMLRDLERMPPEPKLAHLFTRPMLRVEAVVQGLGLSPQEAHRMAKLLEEIRSTSMNTVQYRQRVHEVSRDWQLPPAARQVLLERAAALWNDSTEKAQPVEVYTLDTLRKGSTPKGGNYYRRVKLPNGRVKYFYSEAEYRAWPDAHLSGEEVAQHHARHAVMGEVARAGEKGVSHEDLAHIAKKHGGKAVAAVVKEGLGESGHYVWHEGRVKARTQEHLDQHAQGGGEQERQREQGQPEQPMQKARFVLQGAAEVPVFVLYPDRLQKADAAMTPQAAPRFTMPATGGAGRHVTPIGGITPGGYKKLAEDVYVPMGQQARQPGQTKQPTEQQPAAQPQAQPTPAPQQPQQAAQAAPRFAIPAQAGQPPAQPSQAAPGAAQAVQGQSLPQGGQEQAPGQTQIQQPPPKGAKLPWVAHLEGLPKDTQQAHRDPKTGAYTPERQKLHDQLATGFLAGRQPPPKGTQKVAIVTMGGPASGKSTLTDRLLGDQAANFVLVDPDQVKVMLPEYKQAAAGRARDAAAMVHEESGDVAHQVLQEGILRGLNLVVDGTGRNAEKHAKKVEDLKRQGYHVHVIMPDVDPDEAMRRSMARAEKTGRYVPAEFVKEAHAVIPKNFEKVARAAHEFSLYDSRRQPPVRVWSGGEGQKDQVHDPDFMAGFWQRHGGGKGAEMTKSRNKKQKKVALSGDEMASNVGSSAGKPLRDDAEGEFEQPGGILWTHDNDFDYDIEGAVKDGAKE